MGTRRDYTKKDFATTPLGKHDADKKYSYSHLRPGYTYNHLKVKEIKLDTFTRGD